MSTEFAVITVPVTEWHDLKSQLATISKSILELKNKGQKELLTIKEAMELLKCSRNTLQSYIDKGLLETVKMKKEKYSKILIKRSDIEYFINNR